MLKPAPTRRVGLLLALLSRALGAWVLFSSLAFYSYEQALYERILEQDLDILDGLVSAEIAIESAKHYDGSQADQKPMQLEEIAGTVTCALNIFSSKRNVFASW